MSGKRGLDAEELLTLLAERPVPPAPPRRPQESRETLLRRMEERRRMAEMVPPEQAEKHRRANAPYERQLRAARGVATALLACLALLVPSPFAPNAATPPGPATTAAEYCTGALGTLRRMCAASARYPSAPGCRLGHVLPDVEHATCARLVGHADAQGVPRALVVAMAYRESGFDPGAFNEHEAAVGAMQIQRRHWCRDVSTAVCDAEAEARGVGALRYFVRRAGGDVLRGVARYKGERSAPYPDAQDRLALAVVVALEQRGLRWSWVWS